MLHAWQHQATLSTALTLPGVCTRAERQREHAEGVGDAEQQCSAGAHRVQWAQLGSWPGHLVRRLGHRAMAGVRRARCHLRLSQGELMRKIVIVHYQLVLASVHILKL